MRGAFPWAELGREDRIEIRRSFGAKTSSGSAAMTPKSSSRNAVGGAPGPFPAVIGLRHWLYSIRMKVEG